MQIIRNIFNNVFRRRYKRFNRKINLSKRQLFVIITVILTLGMFTTQLVSVEWRYPMVLVLSLITYFLTAFALREDLSPAEWITLLTLPTLFTAGVAIYYFLLPVRWLTRLPIAILYAVGIYALLLTENIYNVAAVRTIALLRAAHSVGFFLSLLTFYLLIQTVYAIRFHFTISILLTGITSFILFLQLFWAIILENRIKPLLVIASGVLSLIMMEISFIISFIPANVTLISLFLTTCFYTLGGVVQQYLQGRLYRKTLNEFTALSIIVFIILILGTRWR